MTKIEKNTEKILFSFQLNNIQDVEAKLPGLLEATVDWFKNYKIPDGKPANTFAFNAEAKDKDFALKVVKDLHVQWKSLVEHDQAVDGVAKGAVDNSEAVVEGHAACGDPLSIPDSVDKWHHVPK